MSLNQICSNGGTNIFSPSVSLREISTNSLLLPLGSSCKNTSNFIFSDSNNNEELILQIGSNAGIRLPNTNITSYTQTTLNCYDSRLISRTSAGARVETLNLQVSRIGALVTVTMAPLPTGNSLANTQITFNAGTLPTPFRPVGTTVPISFVVPITELGVIQSGLLEVFPDGGIIISSDVSGGAFSSGNSCALPSLSFSYSVQT